MINVIKGDITTLNVDAIVNAANTTLLGGGGVDGAIHKAAGKELLQECRSLNGCSTGDAKITKGYNLKAKYVIHTVGPIWDEYEVNQNNNQAEILLASAYIKSLLLAEENKITSIAFPCISTGVYGFPNKLASDIAIKEVKKFLKDSEYVKNVTFCCFLDKDFNLYNNQLNETQWQRLMKIWKG